MLKFIKPIMIIISFITSLLTVVKSEQQLWNLSDPLPPVQPAECSVQITDIQHYVNVATGDLRLDLNSNGYEFFSLANKATQSVLGGVNGGIPFMQVASDNFSNPNSAQAELLAQWSDQTCEYYGIEGGSAYNGYDYYTNEILSLYNSGVPIYYEYFESQVYGLCIQYIASLPPTESQNFTYFLTYQNSTGYLLEYAIRGEELCCGIANYTGCACPNGVEAPNVYVYANSTVQYSNYQVFETSSIWPTGFFGLYCPSGFSTAFTAAPSAAPTGSPSTSSGINVSEVFVILFGLLFAVSVGINLFLYWTIANKDTTTNSSSVSLRDPLVINRMI